MKKRVGVNKTKTRKSASLCFPTQIFCQTYRMTHTHMCFSQIEERLRVPSIREKKIILTNSINITHLYVREPTMEQI